MNTEIEVEYRAGYLIPKEPLKHFNVSIDKLLLAQGDHFFCLGHLIALPLKLRSENPDYCLDCYGILKEAH